MSIKSLGHGTKFLFVVRTIKHGAHTHTYDSNIHKATRKHQNLSQDTYIDKNTKTQTCKHTHTFQVSNIDTHKDTQCDALNFK
jgi:hypothetical protein